MNLDKIGMWASITCAVHCSVLPFIVVLFPIVGVSLFVTETFEWLFLSASLILNLVSLCFGFRKHKSYIAFSYAGMGFSLLVITHMIKTHADRNHHFEFDLYNLILFAGGILISLSHYINNKLCHGCKVCHHEGCHH